MDNTTNVNMTNQIQQTAPNRISLDVAMNASLGEVSNDLTVTFKKTVLIRSYETEVIEATSTIKLDEQLVGIERMFVTAVLEIQLEYTVYTNLAIKGLVTNTEFINRKAELEEELYTIKSKADSLLGVGKIDRFINFENLTK